MCNVSLLWNMLYCKAEKCQLHSPKAFLRVVEELQGLTMDTRRSAQLQGVSFSRAPSFPRPCPQQSAITMWATKSC